MTTINITTVAGATDDAALAIAMADTSATLSIYFPAGGGRNPGLNGDYEISTDPWAVPDVTPSRGNITRSNVTLYGDGMYTTIIRQPFASNQMFMAHVDPAAPTSLLTNITIRDMSLLGNSTARNAANPSPSAYNEHNHLLRVAGIAGLTIQDVEFRDFMGDGLNLSSPLSSLVPHNSNLLVERCRFDGVNNLNRNGISILDCDTWDILGCAFLNVTRAGQPAAIDIEPEQSDAVVRAGTVYNCSFQNLGGFAVSLYNGHGAGGGGGLDFTYCSVQNAAHGPLAIDNYDNVTATNLYVINVNEPFVIGTTDTAVVKDNYFDTADMALLGYQGTATNVTIESNAFVNCEKDNGPVIAQDGNVENVVVKGNQVVDSGRPATVSPFYFVRQPLAAVNGLLLQDNVVREVSGPREITDIGRKVGGHSAAVTGVVRINNTVIPGALENL